MHRKGSVGDNRVYTFRCRNAKKRIPGQLKIPFGVRILKEGRRNSLKGEREISEKKSECCSTGTTTQPVMQVVYDRNVHTVASHHPLEKTIPLEGCSAFGGKGLDLNPIDLMSMGLASCLMIVMGKTAEAGKLDIVGAKASVSYDLVNYRIAQISVAIHLPKKLMASDQSKLESASKECPVFLAIHPDVKVTVNYIWPK